MIKLENITKSYKTNNFDVKILDNINIDFPKTGMIFVAGKSGSGKSTLLYIIGNLLKPSSGNLFFEENKNEIGFIFQNYNLFNDLTVVDNLKVTAKIKGINKSDEEIDEILKKLDLINQKNMKASLLSGGEAQRVAIARTLILSSNIILADEPTGSLDYENANIINEKLKELSRKKLVVYVTHDLKTARKYADRIITLGYGKIIDDQIIEKTNNVSDSKIENQTEEKFQKNLFSVFFKFSSKFLFKKPLRLFFSIASLIIANVFLLLVFSFSNYNENLTIANYVKKYDIKEYSFHEKKEYKDIFSTPIYKTLYSGENLLEKLENNFGKNNIIRVVKDQHADFSSSSANVFFGKKETIAKHVNLTNGRMMENDFEIVISDFLADDQKYKLDDKITLFFKEFKIVGIFKTDYIDTKYVDKKSRGELSPIDQYNEENKYKVVYLENSSINILKKEDILYLQNGPLTIRQSLYLADDRYRILITHLDNTFEKGFIDLKDDEVLISKSYKENLENSGDKNIFTDKYNFFNYDDEKYNGAFNNFINLSKYFPAGVKIKGTSEFEDAQIIVSKNIYDKIIEKYYDSYYYDKYFVYNDETISLEVINNLDKSMKFSEPVISMIYMFKEILIGVRPMLIFLLATFFVLSTFLLISFLLTNFYQSKKDLAILKSFGFGKKEFFKINLFQILQIMIINLIGLLIFYLGAIFLINFYYEGIFPFRKTTIYLFDLKSYLLTLLISIITLFILNASLSKRIVNVDVVDILKSE